MMYLNLPITEHFFDFTLGGLWNVQIKRKKKDLPTSRIEPDLPDSEFNALPLFQADMLEKFAIKQRFKTSSTIVEMDLYIMNWHSRVVGEHFLKYLLKARKC